MAAMRFRGSALSTLLVLATAWSADPFQQDALRSVPLLDMESYSQRSLLQALVALDAQPSPGLTGAQASGNPADATGPMGGNSPVTGTGPSGMGGPTTGSPVPTDTSTVSPNGADLIEVAQRRTMGALRCRLPIVYGGELWTDCQAVDGSPRCAVRGQRSLKKCAVAANPKSTALPVLLAAGSGADGGNGSICNLGSSQFQLPKCEPIYACLSMPGGPLGTSGLGYCGNPADLPPVTTMPTEPAVVEPPAAAPVADFTIETPSDEPLPMEEAAAPMTGGLTSTDAVTLDEDLDLNPFESILIPKRTTARGTACRLPVVYKGRLIEDCVPISSKTNVPQCFTRGLRFVATCNNATDYITATLSSMLADGVAGDGEDGAVCSLSGDDLSGPACVKGLTCTVLSALPLDGTDIGYCKKGVAAPPSQGVSASVIQVDAAAPAPADVQAAIDALAPTLDASAADQSDETPPDGGAEAAAPTPGGGIPAMSVAQRVTVTGDACRLPLVFGSNLLLDCLPMSSVDAPPQCFTIGVSVPQQCSKDQPWASQTVTELLKQHNGTDGYTGSLCEVDAGKNNDTSVDVTGTCRFGLTCKPLAGALTGSGIGYCAMAAYTNMSDVNEFRVTRRNSIDGAPCRLPLIQGGNLLLDCVSMNSSIPMCMVSGNPVDPPRPCSPAQPGTRVRLVDLIHAKQGMDQAEGSLCTALRTPAVEDPGWQGVGCNAGLTCAAIGGPFNGSEYGYCRKADAPAPSAEPTLADVATSKFALRTTTLGSSCRLPLVYGNTLLLDCALISPGATTPECFVAGQSALQQCSPLGDVKAPVVALSTWLSLPKIPDGLPGAFCHLPSPGVNGSACQQSLACVPLPPGLLNNDTIGYCGIPTDVPMSPRASALSPTAESMLDTLPVASRVTNSGLACRLPVYYNGELLVDCKDSEGTSVCFTQGLSESGTCAPKQAWAKDAPLSQLMAGAPGSDGQEGALCPLVSPPSAPAACLPGLHCTEVVTGILAGGQFGYCSPLSGHVVSDGINGLLIAQRTTPSGTPCRLPVIHNGTLMVDCVAMDGSSVPSCFTKDLTAEPCTADAPAQTLALGALLEAGKGSDGQVASLCLPRGSQAARNVSAMLPCGAGLTCVSLSANDPLLGPGYGFCSPDAAPLPIAGLPGTGTDSVIVTPRTTLTGETCRLPIAFGGRLLTNCISDGGIELCFTQGLEKTASCSATVFPNVTLTSLLDSKQASDGGGGALCMLAPPPTGNPMPCANPIYTCEPFEVGPLVGSSYGHCARGAANGTAVVATGSSSYLDTLPVADRKTLDGARCRLPLVHLGVMYTDCMHVNGVLRCYVLGSSDPPRDCAPLDPTAPPIMATALIAANESADGLSGSLCTLGTLGSPTGEILPCTPGLECTQLEGPLTSAGYGYCEVPLAAIHVAGALYVSPPASGGRSCGPRCVGGAFLGSVVALAAVTGAAYFVLKRQGKARGAQPFGGAFSRFNNAPTGAGPISSLDAAVNGSLRSSGSGGRGLGTLPPEGHVPPTPFSTAFPPGKPGGPANGVANGAANGSGVAALSISRLPSTAMDRTGSMVRQQSAGLSTWAKSRQGSLISPTFLDQYVSPDAGKAPEQEKSA